MTGRKEGEGVRREGKEKRKKVIEKRGGKKDGFFTLTDLIPFVSYL